jgi:hypothetical protein
LGLIDESSVDFQLNKVTIDTNPALNEFRCFVAITHYLANIGRDGSIRIAAKLGNDIIAAAVFSHPTRKESYERLGLRKNELLELTRFCIANKYHKKNFASWFLTRCLKHVQKTKHDVRKILTFADTTFGHTGIIYKATNWQLDGTIKPDYWYTDGRSWYHKKTIWDLASKNGYKELEYAQSKGLHKITGKEKLRYLFSFGK